MVSQIAEVYLFNEKLMAQKKTLEITLELQDINYLFQKPDISPFSRHYKPYSYIAGIEFVANELYADPAYDAVKLELQLSPELIKPGLEEETQAAAARYCSGRLRNVTHEIHSLRWRGTRALAMATVALFVLIIASRLVFSEENLVRQVVSEGLSIAAWVSFWVPLEMLIFKVWEQRLDRKVYTLLSDMEITILPTM